MKKIGGFAIWIVILVGASWGAYHYRHLIFPMHGITILKVIGYAAIPIALALAGNYFAVKDLQDSRWKYMWRAFFMVLGLSGIFLVAVVEKKVDDEHEKEIVEQRAAIQNLIDSNRSLNAAIVNPLSNPEHQQMVATLSAIQGKLNIPKQVVVPQQSRPLSTEERFHAMNDADLKNYGIQLANRLRSFEATYRTNEYTRTMDWSRTMSTTDPQERRRLFGEENTQTVRQMEEHGRQFREQYWADVASIYMELIDRIKAHGRVLPEIPGWEPGGVRMTLSDGTLSGATRVDDIANYLEILARALA